MIVNTNQFFLNEEMLGGDNVYIYFKQSYIDQEYLEVQTVKTNIYTQTNLNGVVIVYNNFYKKLLLDFDVDANYVDAKIYKSIVNLNLNSIHKRI